MKLVIEIPEEDYYRIASGFGQEEDAVLLEKIFKNGILLDSVLDEIKADIEKLDGAYVLRDHVFYAEKDPKDAWFWYIRLKEVIDILDKYKKEESKKEQNNLWMNMIFDQDKINAKTEQWTKEAEEAGMTLTEYLESISPLNNKESEDKE